MSELDNPATQCRSRKHVRASWKTREWFEPKLHRKDWDKRMVERKRSKKAREARRVEMNPYMRVRVGRKVELKCYRENREARAAVIDSKKLRRQREVLEGNFGNREHRR